MLYTTFPELLFRGTALIMPLSYRFGRYCLSPVHCSGGIILGFEQFRASGGLKKRGTPAEEQVSTSIPFRTPWNHLESGILFGLHLPTLVFREDGITGGIFDIGVSDVFIHPMLPPHIKGAAKDALRQVFQTWAARVREHYYNDKHG